MPKSTILEIWRVPKVRQVNPSPPPLTYFFSFFVASVINIPAKFEGSSNSHSRDMMGSQNLK